MLKCILLESGKIISEGNTHRVISQYQNGLNNNSSKFIFKKNGKNAGDSFVVLKEAWITNKKNKSLEIFSMNEDIIVHIKFKILKPLKKMAVPNIQIIDNTGKCVFSSSLTSSKILFNKPGEFVSNVHYQKIYLTTSFFLFILR